MINVKKATFFVLLVYSLQTYTTNKIVILISHPRALSVAFLRMMETRGDFKIMHEPFVCPFDTLHLPEETKGWFIPEALNTYKKVKQAIFEYAEHSNVFIKEMSFAIKEFLFTDEDFITNPYVHFVFLVRNPHHSLISLYKKDKELLDDETINNGLAEWASYKDLHAIVEHAAEHNTNPPLIIRTENLYNNPQKTVLDFCNHLNIPYLPESLSWNNLENDFDIHKEWNESKHVHHVQHWHGDALCSTGFTKPRQYEVDKHGQPTFAEITHKEHKTLCQTIYKDNMVYYRRLLQFEKKDKNA